MYNRIITVDCSRPEMKIQEIGVGQFSSLKPIIKGVPGNATQVKFAIVDLDDTEGVEFVCERLENGYYTTYVRSGYFTEIKNHHYEILVELDGEEWWSGHGILYVKKQTPSVGEADVGPTGPRGEAGPTGPRGDVGPTGEKGDRGDAGPAGPTGEVGPTGPQGSEGVPGPQGFMGEKGEQGPVGPVGPTGDVGPTGPKGSVGPTGPQGERGDVGPTGPRGEQGIVGPKGDRGERGVQGEQGPRGFAGPKGDQGDRGPAGPMGNTGLTGERGPTGPQGSVGPVGPKGDVGATGAAFTYEMFTPEQLSRLVGPTGPKGDVGEPFAIYTTYSTIDDMVADFDNVPVGKFVMISTELESPDNSKLFLRRADAWKFINDLSGAQGIKGPTGPKGDRGDTGPQGPRGFEGATGAVGATGPKGEPGATGPKGDVGAIGPRGPQGDTGATGARGEKGDKGDKGETGATGERGPVGPQGPQGIQGFEGPQGPRGYVGETGATGPKGDKGERGDTGATGATGPAGQSIVGPQGPRGEKGERGDTGPEGPRGFAGPKGDQGDKGDRGPKGDTGLTGDIGPTGPKGADGEVGPTGPRGEKGDAGPTGPQGIPGIGITGPQGPRGETGPTGARGDTGPTGPRGPAGGPTGPTGPTGPMSNSAVELTNSSRSERLTSDLLKTTDIRYVPTVTIEQYPSKGTDYQTWVVRASIKPSESQDSGLVSSYDVSFELVYDSGTTEKIWINSERSIEAYATEDGFDVTALQNILSNSSWSIGSSFEIQLRITIQSTHSGGFVVRFYDMSAEHADLDLTFSVIGREMATRSEWMITTFNFADLAGYRMRFVRGEKPSDPDERTMYLVDDRGMTTAWVWERSTDMPHRLEWVQVKFGGGGVGDVTLEDLAPEYDYGYQHLPGDVVRYEGKVYVCTTETYHEPTYYYHWAPCGKNEGQKILQQIVASLRYDVNERMLDKTTGGTVAGSIVVKEPESDTAEVAVEDNAGCHRVALTSTGLLATVYGDQKVFDLPEDAEGFNTLATVALVDTKTSGKLGVDDTAADSAKLGGVKASEYARKTDVPKRVSNDKNTSRIDGEGNVYGSDTILAYYYCGDDIYAYDAANSGGGDYAFTGPDGGQIKYGSGGAVFFNLRVVANTTANLNPLDGNTVLPDFTRDSKTYKFKATSYSISPTPTDRLARESQLADKLDSTAAAEAFRADGSYAPGDYVTKDGLVYKCVTAHSGAWNASHFSLSKIIDADASLVIDDVTGDLKVVDAGGNVIWTSEDAAKYGMETIAEGASVRSNTVYRAEFSGDEFLTVNINLKPSTTLKVEDFIVDVYVSGTGGGAVVPTDLANYCFVVDDGEDLYDDILVVMPGEISRITFTTFSINIDGKPTYHVSKTKLAKVVVE